MTATITRPRTGHKLLASAAILGAAAAVAGLGTFGSFTDSTTPVDATVSSGTLDINLNTVTAGTALVLSNAIPGDSTSRPYDLVNAGTIPAAVSLNSAAATQNVLLDKAKGLMLGVDRCSVAWTPATSAAGVTTYTCTGTKTTLLDTAAGAGGVVSNVAVSPKLAAKETAYLLLNLGLSTAADNSAQGLTNTLSLTFVGISAEGTTR